MIIPTLSAQQLHFLELARQANHDFDLTSSMTALGDHLGLLGCSVQSRMDEMLLQRYGWIHKPSNSLFANHSHIPLRILVIPRSPFEFQSDLSMISGDMLCQFERESQPSLIPNSASYILNSASTFARPITTPITLFDVDKKGQRKKVTLTISQDELKALLDIRIDDLKGKIKNSVQYRLTRSDSGVRRYVFVGDLIQATEDDITRLWRLGKSAVKLINDYLASISDGKLKLNLKVTGWSRPLPMVH